MGYVISVEDEFLSFCDQRFIKNVSGFGGLRGGNHFQLRKKSESYWKDYSLKYWPNILHDNLNLNLASYQKVPFVHSDLFLKHFIGNSVRSDGPFTAMCTLELKKKWNRNHREYDFILQ